jgi:hypothetical protein
MDFCPCIEDKLCYHVEYLGVVMGNRLKTAKRMAIAKKSAKISAEEMVLRAEAVRQASANNRIEGIYRDPTTDPIFKSFERGEIDATDIVPLLKAHYRIS